MLVRTEGARVASIHVRVLNATKGTRRTVTAGGMVVHRIGAHAGAISVCVHRLLTGKARIGMRVRDQGSDRITPRGGVS